MSGHRYREALPAECPPSAAFDADDRFAWRAIAHESPEASDFDPLAKVNPTWTQGKTDTCVCNAHAVSVFEDKNSAKMVKMLKRKQHLKYLAEVKLAAGTGKIFPNGKDTHVSWWIFESCCPIDHVLSTEKA